MRDSTLLSESMSIESFFALLSDFFDCTAGAVLTHGGEILSYIGDAVFAIFPIGESDKPLETACTPEEGACAAALAAARDARTRVEALNQTRQQRGEPTLEFGLALHVGDVMYGNIGVPERLQFTVIGAAANEASRLAGIIRLLEYTRPRGTLRWAMTKLWEPWVRWTYGASFDRHTQEHVPEAGLQLIEARFMVDELIQLISARPIH
jgi:class 3 adenylate cyclase